MRTLRPLKRSVSPFGLKEEERDPLSLLIEIFDKSYAFKDIPPDFALKTLDDVRNLPRVIKKVHEAASNDAPELSNLCAYILKFKLSLDDQNVLALTQRAMEELFQVKTQIFLVDAEVVLFSKERNTLVGQYFSPMMEKEPGEFAKFVGAWTSDENQDRILHFLDFCAGAKDPTFEYYLLFSHPALSRAVGDKELLRSLFQKTEKLRKKLTSSTWEENLRKTLEF